MWRAARKKNSEKTPQSCRGWWNMRGAFCPGARRVETVGRHSKALHGKKSTQEFVPFGEKVLAKTNILRTVEQNESQIQVRSVAGSEKQQC